MRQIIAIVLFYSSLILPLWANEAATKTLEEQQRDTIRYGTDAEILELVKKIEEGKDDYLDDDLAAVLNSTKNGKIKSTVFSYFGDRKKGGLEEAAIKTIQDRDSESNDSVENAIAYLGLVVAKDAVPILRELLDSEEKRFMSVAVRALGRVSQGELADESAGFLIDYYGDRELSEDVLQEIVIALGETHSKKAVSFLSDLAKDVDEKPVRRMAALAAIGKIGDSGGLDAVLDALSSSDANVRSSAVAVLGPFSGAEVDHAILEAFRDSFYKTRIGAAKAAGERKLEAAIPYLRYRVERDSVVSVREESLRALASIGSQGAYDVVKSVFDNKTNADQLRIVAADMLIKGDSDRNVKDIIAAVGEAKSKKQTALYNGIMKSLAIAKSDELETLARSLLSSSDFVDKLYGLSIVKENGFSSLSETVRALSTDKNETLIRKAKEALEAIGTNE